MNRWKYLRRRASDIESQGITLVPTSSIERPHSLSNGDASHTKDSVEVIVGEGSGALTFHVNKTELCRHSEYFRRALQTQTVHNRTTLNAEDPCTFQLFHTWLERQDPSPEYKPNEYSDEPWRSLAARAHILGQHLQAREFMRYAFAQFILNCALVEPDTWHFIETNTESDQPLRRFTNHWIAWNTSLNQSEYLSFDAALLVGQITNTTRDPRTYLIDHWDQPCADILGGSCVHNVKAQEIVSQSIRPVYAETGRDWELAQRGLSALPTAWPPSIPLRAASSYIQRNFPSSYPPARSVSRYQTSSVSARARSRPASTHSSSTQNSGATWQGISCVLPGGTSCVCYPPIYFMPSPCTSHQQRS